jgi:hypothetical protein
MGRRKSRRTLEKEAEQKIVNSKKSVYDMSKYNSKSFKKSDRRQKRSVHDGIGKSRNTKKIDWI